MYISYKYMTCTYDLFTQIIYTICLNLWLITLIKPRIYSEKFILRRVHLFGLGEIRLRRLVFCN